MRESHPGPAVALIHRPAAFVPPSSKPGCPWTSLPASSHRTKPLLTARWSTDVIQTRDIQGRSPRTPPSRFCPSRVRSRCPCSRCREPPLRSGSEATHRASFLFLPSSFLRPPPFGPCRKHASRPVVPPLTAEPRSCRRLAPGRGVVSAHETARLVLVVRVRPRLIPLDGLGR